MSGQTYKLSLKDRVNLLNVLPREGNILTYRIVQELQTKLSFSEAEIADYKITLTEVGSTGNFRTTWNKEGEKAFKTVTIGPSAESVIANRLKELNDKGVCPFQWMDLYIRFVEQKNG